MNKNNYNLPTFGDKFSGKIHKAFKQSSINKFYSNIEIDRMITYNEILSEFIELGYFELYDDFEKRICDGENPNLILESLILKNEETISTLGYLLETIQYYIDKDIMKKYF